MPETSGSTLQQQEKRMLLWIQLALTVWLCVRYNQAGKPWYWGIWPFAGLLVVGALLGPVAGFVGLTADASWYTWLNWAAVAVMGWFIYKTK